MIKVSTVSFNGTLFNTQNNPFDHTGILYYLAPNSVVKSKQLHLAEKYGGDMTERYRFPSFAFVNDLPRTPQHILDNLGFYRRANREFRFMHALEHIVVTSLIINCLGHLDSDQDLEPIAKTASFSGSVEGNPECDLYGFLVKKGFATHDNVMSSIRSNLEIIDSGQVPRTKRTVINRR